MPEASLLTLCPRQRRPVQHRRLAMNERSGILPGMLPLWATGPDTDRWIRKEMGQHTLCELRMHGSAPEAVGK